MNSSSRPRTKRLGLVVGATAVCLVVWLFWLNAPRRPLTPAREEAVRSIAATNAEKASILETLVTNLGPPKPAFSADEGKPEVVGIGAELVRPNAANGVVQIVRVLPGSPAELAGLQPPLNVHKVDGVSLLGLPFSETVRMIRGPVGTKVRLELSEVMQDETFTVEITRQKLEL